MKILMGSTSSPTRALLRQGWISLAIWIAFGILVEGLVGYRIPALLDDLNRREMFRLAHAHGTLLNIVLIIVAVCVRLELIRIGRLAALGLRLAAVLCRLDFFSVVCGTFATIPVSAFSWCRSARSLFWRLLFRLRCQCDIRSKNCSAR